MGLYDYDPKKQKEDKNTVVIPFPGPLYYR